MRYLFSRERRCIWRNEAALPRSSLLHNQEDISESSQKRGLDENPQKKKKNPTKVQGFIGLEMGEIWWKKKVMPGEHQKIRIHVHQDLVLVVARNV